MTKPLLDRDGYPWPVARTSNGVLIVPGLKVRDYNWRESVVTDRAPHVEGGEYVKDDSPRGYHFEGGTPWFDTTGGMFDGSRMLAL